MISDGFYKHLTTKSGKNGREQVELTAQGPTHHIFTTISNLPRFDIQFLNRSFVVPLDPSEDQIWSVLQQKFRGATETVDQNTSLPHLIAVESWNLFFASLRPLDPAQPNGFADIDLSCVKLKEERPGDLKLNVMRGSDLFKMLLISHCVAHQHQRQTGKRQDGRDVLIAELADFAAAELMFSKYTYQPRTLSDTVAKNFKDIAGHLSTGARSDDLENVLNLSERTMRTRIDAWKKNRLIEIVGTKGKEHIYGLGPEITDRIPKLKDAGVPSAEELQAAVQEALAEASKRTASLPIFSMVGAVAEVEPCGKDCVCNTPLRMDDDALESVQVPTCLPFEQLRLPE